jgi:Tol biopolymer transport system component/DNA-binding winged helix-turn-helix (wHTH) protein
MTEHKCLVFKFADVEVREREFRLVKAGEVLSVEPKAFRVLLFLLRNPHRLIPKDELLNAVWNDYAVSENSLTRAIATLRRLLGDDIHEPRYIATVPTVGYRFLCNVEATEDGFSGLDVADAADVRDQEIHGSPHTPQVQPVVAKAKGLRSMILWLAPVLLIVIAAFFYVRHISQPPAFYSSVPLTNYVGSEICPSFAPDGERVAFAWNGEKQDNFDIYVKQIGDGTLLRLTSDPKPDLSPAWSPDGRTIAFLRLDSDEKGEILLMSSFAEGPARSLAAVTAPLTLYPQSKFIAWSPDGKWLAMSDGPSFGGVMSLFLLSVETGEKRRITLPPNDYDDVDPSFSPDMRHVAFARYTGQAGSTSDLYVVNLSPDLQSEGSPERITFYNRHLASPVWSSDGRSILFTRTEPAGNHSIWRINLSGSRKSEPLPVSADSSSALDLSRRGNRLVYTREISNATVWAVDLPPSKSKSSRSSNPRPWISSTQGAIGPGNPQFSPDGQQVAFRSDSSGTGEIWVCDRDGSHARQLTHMGAIVSNFPRWSPDGKNIVFHSRPKGLANLYVVSAEGGPAHRLDAGDVDDLGPSWSHDGKWIYFSSRETGDVQVWKMPAGGGPRIQITKRAGNVPLESADGQYLYYVTIENALWRVPLAGGEGAEVLPALVPIGSSYALGKQGIYFMRPTGQGGGQEIAFLRLATRQISPIVSISRSLTDGLALSPDERLILYSQRETGSDLMLIENFH